ncbi:BQ2448_5344 [Microbotryum intermedium]|uniref:BQ2448_5344 protein n=1 Tax=Microbotryum intermedium TaxID=269621 RepID=A0A238F6U9_9BASI|nr:BQ2448_5344 [Microbotryum intermedium]
MMTGETNLQQLLSGLELLLDDEVYTFCTAPLDSPTPPGCIGTFDEREGRTLILPLKTALATAGVQDDVLGSGGEWAKITLQIHSSLEAVGFIACIATALAKEGIPRSCLCAMAQAARRDEGYSSDRAFGSVVDGLNVT